MRLYIPSVKSKFIVLVMLLSLNQNGQSQDRTAAGGGFGSLRREDISFENLPIDAPRNLVAVIPSKGRNFVLSPDDRWLFLSEGYLSQGYGQILNVRKLKLIDTKTWEQVPFSPEKAGKDSASQFRVVFSPNGQFMLTVSSGSNWEHSLQIWNMTGKRPKLIAFFHISSRLDDENYYAWRHLNYSSSRTNIVSNKGEVLISSRGRTALLKLEGKKLLIAVDAPVGGELAITSEDFKRISFLKESGEIWEYGVKSNSLTGIRKSRIAQVEGGSKIDLDSASVHPRGLALVAIDGKRGACIWTKLGQTSSAARVLSDPLSRTERKVYGSRAISADGRHFTLTESNQKQSVTHVYDQSGKRLLEFTHKLPLDHDVRVLPTSDRSHLLVSDRDETTGYRLLVYRLNER